MKNEHAFMIGPARKGIFAGMLLCGVAAFGQQSRAETLSSACTISGNFQLHFSIDLAQRKATVSNADATSGPYPAIISDKFLRWTVPAPDANSLEQRYTIDRVMGTVTYERFLHGNLDLSVAGPCSRASPKF